MPDQRPPRTKRLLEPIDRISEILFGLIMVLTFTGSLRVIEADRAIEAVAVIDGDADGIGAASRLEVRAMLIGALGCNTVWGLIDAVLYLMGSLFEKGRNLTILRTVRRTADPRQAERLIADALPEVVASVLDSTELQSLHEKLRRLPEPPQRPSLDKNDWLGALGVFLLVFLSTFPVAVPFLFLDDIGLALRLSNTIAIAMLFIAGYAYGRCIRRNPWQIGIVMVLLGCALVGLTMLLGG